MRPKKLKTKIFLDGGDPGETKEIIDLFGFLDGQTTNPTLISRNPKVRKRLEQGQKFKKKEILIFYREVVNEISEMIPQGSVSVEVYADDSTTAEQMLAEGLEMSSWIPNAHIKFPSTKEGLKAAENAVRAKLRVNMTLCFKQEQAAAVYSATLGSNKGEVFVSPFVGRLDDRGENGMDLIKNTLKMYQNGDGHVELLTASVRNIDHLLYGLKLESDIISVPFKILKQWGQAGLEVPGPDYVYDAHDLRMIPYAEIDLTKNWMEYDIDHELTTKGIERFSADWNALIR
jgi:transaldolase